MDTIAINKTDLQSLLSAVERPRIRVYGKGSFVIAIIGDLRIGSAIMAGGNPSSKGMTLTALEAIEVLAARCLDIEPGIEGFNVVATPNINRERLSGLSSSPRIRGREITVLADATISRETALFFEIHIEALQERTGSTPVSRDQETREAASRVCAPLPDPGSRSNTPTLKPGEPVLAIVCVTAGMIIALFG